MCSHAHAFVRASSGARKAPFKRKNGARSAKIALHTPVSAFERHDIPHKRCNRYSKDALRQGDKRGAVPLQQENETFGQVSCLEVKWKFV